MFFRRFYQFLPDPARQNRVAPGFGYLPAEKFSISLEKLPRLRR